MKQTVFATALLSASTHAAEAPRYQGPKTPFYVDHVFITTEKVPFNRLRKVEVVEKFEHAHSGESASDEYDSLHSEHSSYYSDDCPNRYDCSDSTDYSLHSSDDSKGHTSHDHDRGYYGYDYYYSDTESHYDDRHAHIRVTERYQKVPEVFTQQKLTYVRAPRARTSTVSASKSIEHPYGVAPGTHYVTKPDPWAGSDPFPTWGKYLGSTGRPSVFSSFFAASASGTEECPTSC